MTTPAYFRAWRAAHPEYRARQNVIRNARRRLRGRDRIAEYARRRRRSQVLAPMPGLHTGHPLFVLARAVVGPRRTSLRNLYDPLYDDMVSEAVIALLEGADPHSAVRRYGSRERAWGRVTAPLLEWVA